MLCFYIMLRRKLSWSILITTLFHPLSHLEMLAVCSRWMRDQYCTAPKHWAFLCQEILMAILDSTGKYFVRCIIGFIKCRRIVCAKSDSGISSTITTAEVIEYE